MTISTSLLEMGLQLSYPSGAFRLSKPSLKMMDSTSPFTPLKGLSDFSEAESAPGSPGCYWDPEAKPAPLESRKRGDSEGQVPNCSPAVGG